MDAPVSIHNPLTSLSGVTDWGARGRAAPRQAKCRSWAPSIVDILKFGFLWVVAFLRFSGCFRFFGSIGFIFSYKIFVRLIYNGVFKQRQTRHLPRVLFATAMCKVAYLAFKWGPTETAMYKWAALLSKGPPIAVVMRKSLAFKGAQNNCNALFFQRVPWLHWFLVLHIPIRGSKLSLGC